MKNRDTDIIFILDRSGSMHCVEDATIDGYNDFLEQEKKNRGNIYVTTVLFDDMYELLYSREMINNVSKLNHDVYYSRGCTALMDAIGKTIIDMDKKIPKNHRVIVVIMTDGLENASVEYDKDKIEKLIKNHNKWEFVFLGANIDSYAEGTSIGISEDKIANFKQNGKSVCNVFKCARMMCEDFSFDLQAEIDK